jgi:hypothetical protein
MEDLPVDPGTREPMPREAAVLLVQQALDRIRDEPKNHGDRGWQCGGAYWRLAKVLDLYLYPRLVTEEGDDHAAFIIREHGRIQREP